MKPGQSADSANSASELEVQLLRAIRSIGDRDDIPEDERALMGDGTQVTYEVFKFENEEWEIVARYNRMMRKDAFEEAMILENSPNVRATKVILEVYDPREGIAEERTVYRSQPSVAGSPPPQKSAIVLVEYGEDGRLHRRPNRAPRGAADSRDEYLGTAWVAHCNQLSTLEGLRPGRNVPALGQAMKHYRDALGTSFDNLNVIALGIHGTRLEAYAARADELLLEDAASELTSLAVSHGLFIRQFQGWLDYVQEASDDPPTEAIEAGVEFSKATSDASGLIAEDVSTALNELADLAALSEMEAGGEVATQMIQRELLRSVGNVLAGMFQPLVDYARDAASTARQSTLNGMGMG